MKHKSRDYKISAVKYYLKSLNYTETATIFGCSRQSLTRWAKQFEKGKDIKRKIKKNISYKITKKHIFFIKHRLEKNKQITINRLHQNLIKKFLNLKISLSHLYRIVKDINYSLKKVKFQHIPKTRYGKKINIKESKKKFYDYLYKKQPEDIICIDETSLKLFTVPYQSRTQAIEGFFNLLKSKLSNKKDLGYEKLYQNVENILKEIPEKIYYNLIFGAYFKPQKKRKINTKKEKIYKD